MSSITMPGRRIHRRPGGAYPVPRNRGASYPVPRNRGAANPIPRNRGAASPIPAPRFRKPPVPPLPAPTHKIRIHRGAPHRVAKAIGQVLTTAALVAAIGAFLALAVGPHVLGYRTATMLTGSMAPTIKPGDVVVAWPEPAAGVKVGDVITYHIPVDDHRVETHRVIEVINGADGSISVRTQGDANPGPDPWTAKLDGNTIWQVKSVVPVAGTAIRALRTPAVHVALMWGAPALLVGLALATIWRPRGTAARYHRVG